MPLESQQEGVLQLVDNIVPVPCALGHNINEGVQMTQQEIPGEQLGPVQSIPTIPTAPPISRSTESTLKLERQPPIIEYEKQPITLPALLHEPPPDSFGQLEIAQPPQYLDQNDPIPQLPDPTFQHLQPAAKAPISPTPPLQHLGAPGSLNLQNIPMPDLQVDQQQIDQKNSENPDLGTIIVLNI